MAKLVGMGLQRFCEALTFVATLAIILLPAMISEREGGRERERERKREREKERES